MAGEWVYSFTSKLFVMKYPQIPLLGLFALTEEQVTSLTAKDEGLDRCLQQNLTFNILILRAVHHALSWYKHEVEQLIDKLFELRRRHSLKYGQESPPGYEQDMELFEHSIETLGDTAGTLSGDIDILEAIHARWLNNRICEEDWETVCLTIKDNMALKVSMTVRLSTERAVFEHFGEEYNIEL